MKEDDETEDMIFSFVFVAVTIFTVLFFLVGVASLIWSFI
jgi:hypothetical protein